MLFVADLLKKLWGGWVGDSKLLLLFIAIAKSECYLFSAVKITLNCFDPASFDHIE